MKNLRFTCVCGHVSTSEKAAREHATAPTPQSTEFQPGCPKVLGKIGGKLPKRFKAEALEKVGRAALEEAPEPPKKSAKKWVAIWYESEGGEVLRVDVGPLTRQAADELTSHLERSDAARFVVRERPGLAPGDERDPARLVTFPSQVEDLKEAA